MERSLRPQVQALTNLILGSFVVGRAGEHLKTYTPDMDSLDSVDVPPLTEFFEMVHVGDVIQQMLQLYYDEEIVSHTAVENIAIVLTSRIIEQIHR